jgi:hypothetical protein
MVRYESNFVWVSFPHHIIVQQIEVVAVKSVIHFVIASKIKYRTVGIGPPF